MIGHEDEGVGVAAVCGASIEQSLAIEGVVLVGHEGGLAVVAARDDVPGQVGELDARAAGMAESLSCVESIRSVNQ